MRDHTHSTIKAIARLDIAKSRRADYPFHDAREVRQHLAFPQTEEKWVNLLSTYDATSLLLNAPFKIRDRLVIELQKSRFFARVADGALPPAPQPAQSASRSPQEAR
jgi:hypothetical protein